MKIYTVVLLLSGIAGSLCAMEDRPRLTKMRRRKSRSAQLPVSRKEVVSRSADRHPESARRLFRKCDETEHENVCDMHDEDIPRISSYENEPDSLCSDRCFFTTCTAAAATYVVIAYYLS